jgi:molybdate transport system ATP-binding protein
VSLLALRIRAHLAHFELDLGLESRSRALGFFGPSGAGKSTVLEVLAGWRRVELAQVTLDGRTLVDSQRRVWLHPERRGIGYVPQDVLLFEHWNVWRNVTAGSQRGGPSDQQLVAKVLDVLELNAERRRAVGELSGGERQRVALARALCSRPELLLLDEPLGALDRRLRRRILPYLIRVREEFGVPLVFVSHDATEVAALCDEVVVLSQGRVAAHGPPAEVFSGALGARAVGSDLENVLAAPVSALAEGTATLDLGAGLALVVPRAGLSLGERAVVAVRSDDVLLATERPAGLSARNVLPAQVLDWVEDGGDVILRLALGGAGAADGAPRLSVQLTAAALRELGLERGKRVFAIFKTRATRVLSALESGEGGG